MLSKNEYKVEKNNNLWNNTHCKNSIIEPNKKSFGKNILCKSIVNLTICL